MTGKQFFEITSRPADPNAPHAVIERILVSDLQPPFFGLLAFEAWGHDPDTGERFWIGAPCTKEVAEDAEALRHAVQMTADFELEEHRKST